MDLDETGVDLPGEAYTATLLYDKNALMKPINLQTNAFGQNFNVTMIQMASLLVRLLMVENIINPILLNLSKTAMAIRSRILTLLF